MPHPTILCTEQTEQHKDSIITVGFSYVPKFNISECQIVVCRWLISFQLQSYLAAVEKQKN